MSISLRSNSDGSGTLLNGSTPVMEITAAGVVSLPNIAAGSSANQPVNLGQFIGTNVSLSANGYQKLPSGLIIQWGVTGVISVGSGERQIAPVTFPIAFPTGFLNSFASQTISVNRQMIVATESQTLTGLTFSAANYATTGGSVIGRWLAIGY